MAKKKTTKKKSDEPTFEASLSDLETIVGELEGGELPLADALGRYEEAVAHLKRCHAALEQAEGRIEQLSGVDADGNPTTRPFRDPGGESLDDKAASRSRRRTAKGAGVDDGEQLF